MKYKCELRFLVGTGTVLTAYKVEKDGSTTQLFGQEVSALRTFHMEGENLVLTGLLRFGYAFSCEHGDLVSFKVSAPSFIRARSTKPVDEVAVKHKLFIYDGFLYMSEDIADYEANALTKKGDYLDKEHPSFSFRASAYINCSERFGALGIASHRNVAYLQLYLYSFRWRLGMHLTFFTLCIRSLSSGSMQKQRKSWSCAIGSLRKLRWKP